MLHLSSTADLVLFKRDFNYRKLTYDDIGPVPFSWEKRSDTWQGNGKDRNEDSGVDNVQSRCLRWVGTWRGKDTAGRLV